MKQLDFREEKVQVISLDDLEHTYHENLVDGTPVNGIYHYVLLQQILELAEKAGLKPEIQEVFAANNRDSKRPGVTVLPQLEAQYGERAIEAHLLRRVYANIALRADETDELVTNLAVAYHQKGVQIGIGPMVKICHNQCILHARDVVSNYSCWFRNSQRGKMNTIEGVLDVVQRWMANYSEEAKMREPDIVVLKNETFEWKDFLLALGQMQVLRVCADSRDRGLRNIWGDYPLNGAQLNVVTEKFMYQKGGHLDTTYWDAYQIFNSILKPRTCDVPQILPQSLMLTDVWFEVMKLRALKK